MPKHVTKVFISNFSTIIVYFTTIPDPYNSSDCNPPSPNPRLYHNNLGTNWSICIGPQYGDVGWDCISVTLTYPRGQLR